MLVQGLRHTYPQMTRNFVLSLPTVARQVESWNGKQWMKITGNALGMDVLAAEPWLKDVMAGFVQQNAALITGLTDDIAAKLEARIIAGVTQGRTAEAIARSIQEGSRDEDGLMTMSRKRARFIARDQIGKLNGQLTRFRQTSLGIGHYKWRTMLDGKVRDAHKVREGKRFSWDKPPDGGAPGEDYNCRCYAEPDFTDIADELPEGFFGEI